ncbi:hypothetical protein AC249_AIPGENE1786 [Exaiptasia diaphana]|nr:hypothetical protein AC249_AIPGENE1786 [Exaiptasia diaphana]
MNRLFIVFVGVAVVTVAIADEVPNTLDFYPTCECNIEYGVAGIGRAFPWPCLNDWRPCDREHGQRFGNTCCRYSPGYIRGGKK